MKRTHPRLPFTIEILHKSTTHQVRYIRLKIRDRFSARHHTLERVIFRKFVNALERYLRRRPGLEFSDPKNLVRKIIYAPSAVKAWAAYIPGGFATHHVHNPDHKRLVSGQKIDYITRSLFRYSADAVGLRARAYATTWFVKTHLQDHQSLAWLSIASGTGQATYDAVQALPQSVAVYLADIDEPSLTFARELATSYGLTDKEVHMRQVDIKQTGAYEATLKWARPDVVEAMGIVEYLTDDEIVSLVRRTLSGMRPKGCFIFSNMLTSHPHLHVHKRGLGWPGVIQRSPEDILSLLEQAGVRRQQISVLLPDDGVYAVYAITS